jgi:mannose-1-phosphate guanylyltransferase
MKGGNVWALILAAGEGTRLSSLTTTAGGLSVPKQFCSLRGGASLLEEALTRAEAVTTRRRIVSVVADHHRRFWQGSMSPLPPGNVIVQPENRGTAAGLLLPLLHVMQRDPAATVLVLPSDHFVLDEPVLAQALRRASLLAGGDADHVYLLGLAPQEPDPELGYIMPAVRPTGAAAPVQRFVEKPSPEVARGLIGAGALLNMFIIAASVRALVSLYATRHAGLLLQMNQAVERDMHCTQDAPAARELYPLLPTKDFSRDVLEGQETRLRVLSVPACGWSDLGTPLRVAETLTRIGGPRRSDCAAGGQAHLNLAEQHSRQQRASRVFALA